MKYTRRSSKRASGAKRRANNAAALRRAREGMSPENDARVISGMIAAGYDPSEIDPRTNCFTYPAWQALGRQVLKGETGVKIPVGKRLASIFHISQTSAIGDSPKPASIREWSTAGVNRKMQAVAENSGFDPGDLIYNTEATGGPVSFSFPGAIPADLKESLEGLPFDVRAMFRPDMPGSTGADTLAEHGADGMIDLAKNLIRSGATGIADHIERVGNETDPQTQLLQVLQALRAGVPFVSRPALEVVQADTLKDGSGFELVGVPFAVYTADGCRRASSGEHDFNLDGLDSIPADKGTVDIDARIAPELATADIPF